jgi:hypothetical protein
VDVDTGQVGQVHGRGRRSPVNRGERAGVAVSKDVDPAAALGLGDLLQQGQAVAADVAADLDILVANGFRVTAYRGGDIGIVLHALDDPEDAFDSPVEVDGRGPGSKQRSGSFANRLARRRAIQCREVQAPGRGRADQRRAAHVHFIDSGEPVLPALEIVNAELVREQPLVDNLDDRGVARLQPDRAEAVVNHPVRPRVLRRAACWPSAS